MKPAPSTLVRESTLPVRERIQFTIGDPRAMMKINARQYSDVTTAVIREYSTNAYDAHLMAGHSDPIEVSLPSVLDPYFEVRDHGIGMNVDTFETIYTRFGTSNKTEDLPTNGQMGIGSKSGVAYTPTFKVISIKDGIRTEAKISREKDWSIFMDILSEDITDEPNGTTIRIAVHNVDEFRHKAHQFFKFWLPGRVLIDGKPSEHYVGQKIAENLYYSRDWNTSYVVMANVAYRIENPSALFRESKLSSLNFVAYVDDLAEAFGHAPIDFTPSREDLEYSELTKSTLQSIITNFERDLISSAQAEIDSAKTHAEAYTAWDKWRSTAGGNLFGDLSFKGDKFKSNFDIRGYKFNPRGGRYSVEAIRQWGVEQCHRTLFVTDFDITISSNVKAKAKAYIEQEHPDDGLTLVVFTHETALDSTISPWVDWTKMSVVSWADLKAALPKAVSGGRSYVPGSGRVPGSWDYYTRDSYVTESPVPTDKTLLWISVKNSKRVNEMDILKRLDSDAVVLVVPMNRLAKLQRDFPQIENFIEWGRKQVITTGSALLTREAKKVFAIDHARKVWLDRLDIDRVDDPELKNIKSLLARKDVLLKEYNHHRTLASALLMGYNGFKDYEATQEDEDFYTKYPLLRSISAYGTPHDHVYVYMNAVHAAESEK